MKFSPVDIKNQHFKTKLRGYDVEEIRSFLELLANELDGTYKENDLLKTKLNEREDEIKQLHMNENNLKKTIFSIQELKENISKPAEAKADIIRREAQISASNILRSAENRANRILEECEVKVVKLKSTHESEIKRLSDRINDLKVQKEQMERNMRNILNSYLKLLDMENQNDELERDLSFLDSKKSEFTSIDN